MEATRLDARLVMGLEKGIEHGKERRQPYRGGKAADRTCRCHGGCPVCERNRTYQDRRERAAAEQEMRQEEYRRLATDRCDGCGEPGVTLCDDCWEERVQDYYDLD